MLQRCVSWNASAASRTFSRIVRSPSWASAFLTNCSAIVEAPWVAPPVASATIARPTPFKSMPESCQKRLSSIETTACRLYLPSR